MAHNNFFLDMCIILHYSHGVRKASVLINKSISFVEKKDKNKFLVCYYILEKDLPNYLERQRIGIQEVMKKISDSSYKIGSSGLGQRLFERDKSVFEKIYHGYVTAKDKIQYINAVNYIQSQKERRIEYFLIHLIDKKVIGLLDIDFDLKSSLFTYIQNNSDSYIIASGIQAHNQEELVLVTADKKDWTKENLEWAMTPQLKKKYPLIPPIIYP